MHIRSWGLPQSVKCPECGREIDHSEIVLYGWGRGHHEFLATAKPSRIVLVFLVSMIWPATQAIQFWFRWRLMAALLLAAAGAIQAFTLIFRRNNSDHPGLIQVRISERGCVQYDRLGGMSVANELLRGHGWLIPLIVALGLIVAFRFGRD